jgi:predicted ester cyclase
MLTSTARPTFPTGPSGPGWSWLGPMRRSSNVSANPKRAAEMSDTIDRVFFNSANETKTASFRENAQQQMRSIGDLNFLIRSVISAVFVALLFSVTTMMVQTMRE